MTFITPRLKFFLAKIFQHFNCTKFKGFNVRGTKNLCSNYLKNSPHCLTFTLQKGVKEGKNRTEHANRGRSLLESAFVSFLIIMLPIL